MLGRKLSVLLVACLVLTSIAPVQAQSESTGIDQKCLTNQYMPDAEWGSIRAEISRPNGSKDTVRISYHAKNIPDEFFLELPEEVNLTRQSGFNRDGRKLRYSGGESPFVEYRLRGESGYWYSSTSHTWTYAPLPDHLNVRANYEVKGAGTAGEDFVYLGNYTKHTFEQGCHTVSLVVSNESEIKPGTEEVFHSLRYASSELDVGHRYDDTRIVVIPGQPDPSADGRNYGDESWVTSRGLRNAEVTELVIHEYVHSRQRFAGSGTADTVWFTEATASFYQLKYGYETGAVSASKYNDALENGSSISAELGNSSTWPSRWTEYRRGFTYIAILNEKMLEASEGEYSIEDLIRGVNSRANGSTPVILQRGLLLDRIERNTNSSVAHWANESISSTGKMDYSAAKVEEPGPITILESQLKQRILDKPLSSAFMWFMMGALLMFAVCDIASSRIWGRPEEEENANEKESNQND